MSQAEARIAEEQSSSNIGVIGIIGEGQLARMLVQAAEKHQLPTAALVTGDATPLGALKAPNCRLFSNESERAPFFKTCSAVLFENEFQDVAQLEADANQAGRNPNAVFFPKLSTLAKLQDKLQQKKICTKLGVPTSAFLAPPQDFAGVADAFAWAGQARAKFAATGVVFKWRRLGYDGKGVLVCKPGETLSPENAEQSAFFSESVRKKTELFAEEFVPFTGECAIIGFRSPSFGTKAAMGFFPLVLTSQKNGVCTQAVGPASQLGLGAEHDMRAQTYAWKIAESLDLWGAFAIELFIAPGDRLLVNEIAPRVHNSGHLTQDAFSFSQFEAHLFCARDRLADLGKLEAKSIFYGMRNLLGAANPPQIPAEQGIVHWYGKAESRPGRKMGHINVLASSAKALEQKMDWLQRNLP